MRKEIQEWIEKGNKFNTVLRLNPDHRKAANYVIMINNILGYYCKDMFNP